MEVTLTSEDFATLSSSAREEILRMLSGPRVAPQPVEANEGEEPAEFTLLLTKKFMENVSDLTRELLRVFAANGGRASLSQLMAKSEYKDWRKLSGFFAGVTKRTRNILQDEEAYLLYWDETTAKFDENNKLIDGDYYMSATTATSMKKYFGL